MVMRAFNDINLRKTSQNINETLEFLIENQEGFGGLSKEAQFRLAMQHYQCERGRLQRGKLYVDIVAHIIPLIMALAALIFAIYK